MFNRIFQRLKRGVGYTLRERVPPGYRAGLTLARLQRDLAPLACSFMDATRIQCDTGEDDLSFAISERTQSLFLSYIVLCEFELSLPASGEVGCTRIELRHTGALKRRSIALTVKEGERTALEPLLQAIQHDVSLNAAILPLDFRRCELSHTDSGWRVRLEHFGASEVVNRLPPMRRYVRLMPDQRRALVASFAAFRRLLVDAPGMSTAENPPLY